MMSEFKSSSRRFWVLEETTEYYFQFHRLLQSDLRIGLMNKKEIQNEEFGRHKARGDKIPFLDDLRCETFANTPHLRLPTSYYPEYFESQGRIFVSPRLFGLLDQPKGTLQGWKTEVSWVGPNPPDRTYLWLSYVPRVPTFDIERSTAEKDEYPNPEGGAPIVQLRYLRELVLRDDMAPPCDVFRAAETGTILLASDAVAETVVRAGCVGIEFVEPETCRAQCHALYRRGAFRAELRPECVECRRAQGLPVPEPEPLLEDEDE